MATTLIGFVITGTGRCGTGYAAEVLSSAGIACGHEEVFGPEGGMEKARSSDASQGDSSWLAIEYLDALRLERVPIINLVRHPVAVVNSLVGMRFWSEDEHEPHRSIAGALLARLGFESTGNDVADSVEWVGRVMETIALYAKPYRIDRSNIVNLVQHETGIDPTREPAEIPANFNQRSRAAFSPMQLSRTSGWKRLLEQGNANGYRMDV